MKFIISFSIQSQFLTTLASFAPPPSLTNVSVSPTGVARPLFYPPPSRKFVGNPTCWVLPFAQQALPTVFF